MFYLFQNSMALHKILPRASEVGLAEWPIAYLCLLKGALGLEFFDH